MIECFYFLFRVSVAEGVSFIFVHGVLLPLFCGTCMAIDLSVNFILRSHLRPMGLNVLGYQSFLLQRCHPACGHE